MNVVASRSSLIRIHTYLILHRVGLYSGGSSLSGWSLPHTYTHTHIHTHTHTQIYMYTHTDVYVHTHTDVYVHTHRCIVHTHTHTQMYMYTHTHRWARAIGKGA